jgi:hypothetical protein
MKYLIAILLTVLLSGCSYIPASLFTNQHECTYIGCETGGMIYYPHEREQDKNEPGENYEL